MIAHPQARSLTLVLTTQIERLKQFHKNFAQQRLQRHRLGIQIQKKYLLECMSLRI